MHEDQEEESKDLQEEGGGVTMETPTVVTETGKFKVSILLGGGGVQSYRQALCGRKKRQRHGTQLGFTIKVIFRVSTDSEQRP